MWKRYTDDINYNGVNLYIKYSFKEGDDQVTYYPDGSGYPGSADQIEIDEIFVGNTDIIGIIEYAKGNFKYSIPLGLLTISNTKKNIFNLFHFV